jgi:hypothetical protein
MRLRAILPRAITQRSVRLRFMQVMQATTQQLANSRFIQIPAEAIIQPLGMSPCIVTRMAIITLQLASMH